MQIICGKGRGGVPAGRRPKISRLGQLTADFPQISEIEINLLRVFSAGSDVIALDVRAQIENNQQLTGNKLTGNTAVSSTQTS